MQTVTLIIDKRRELSVKYKKLLENDYSSVIISKNFISAMKFIQDKEPDLIIISDSLGADLDEYCREIRALTYNMRPIIVAVSKSADISDKLKILESGADDFISEPINSDEFVMRIRAHLRREFETNLDDKKMLPNKNYSMRALKRVLSSGKNWACMLINIENYKNYMEVYTKLASDKLSQTYSAIIASTLNEQDYLGSLDDDQFLVVTDELKAEKVAKFLIFAFDSVVTKFYSNADLERGFTIMQGDSQAGKRSEFVHTTIGIVTYKTREYKDVYDLLADLINIHNLARLPDKSNYLIERTKLSAENAVFQKTYNKKILIVEQDEALNLLLTTILSLQGYETKVVNTFSSFDLSFMPAVIILDTGDYETRPGLEFCKKIKKNPELKNSKLIVTSVFHDKESILKCGADLYLPKPYEMVGLVKWVDSFVKEFNSY